MSDALSWMNNTDGQLSEMSDLMARAKELTIQAISPNPSMAFQVIGQELDGIIRQLVDKANSQIGNRYIFAGQSDKTKPYQRTGDIITYNGDNGKISMPIQPGVANPSQDSLNISGMELFGANNELLNHLI